MEDAPVKPFPWGPAAAVAIFLAMGLLAFWAVHQKKTDQARAVVVSALDKELVDEEAAVKAQRAKFEDLSKQVEQLRSLIEMGGLKDGKAAVDQFNTMAAQQRAEREKFLQMAEQYNQKVAKFHQLEK